MPDYQTSIIRRTLPEATFERLRNLWQQMADLIGVGALLLTEDVFLPMEVSRKQRAERFTVLISERFSALLVGTPISQPLNKSKLGASELDTQYLSLSNQHSPLNVGLTFDPEAIAAFLTQLASQLNNNLALSTLEQASQILQPNDATFQSQFTLSLIEILSLEGTGTSTPELIYPHVSVCQPVEDALRHQVEQERLLNQVISQMRQSLELPVILETTVEQVRHFLSVDRLVIYQFDVRTAQKARSHDSGEVQPTLPLGSSPTTYKLQDSQGEGRVTYESRASDTIPPVLNLTEEKHCFVYVPNLWEKYRQGFTQAVEDIETAYVFSPCFIKLMRRTQVRAKLVVPIVVQEELWGLLIAHQCYEPRQWQESEKIFLRHIAEHLAIAIYQAELYAQVQQQKQTLEQRVVSRTQELYDALLVAESASRFKSEFLATMSHELRTPLTCIIGLSSTLLRWPLGELSQKQQDYLQTIHNSGEHLLEMINNILDLSQVEAGKSILNLSEFSLSQMAQQSLQMVKEKALLRGINLEIDLQIAPLGVSAAPAKQDRFTADLRRVKQILVNLLSNAVKFTPTGGQVTLRVWVEDSTAVLQVEDTGIGIPEHQRSLLFEKFQQLDSSYHRQYEGIGLGLALTKQLVALHGGRVDVESTVGVGSTFTVWLPAQLIAPAVEVGLPQTGSATEAVALYPERPLGSIVLIQDHEEVATLICDILTAAGYQVVWLLEGSTAVEQIKLLQPTAVIVDLQLPGMEGYEIIRCLRDSPATQHLKTLVLTTKGIVEDQERGIAAGANDYLPKPVQPEQLLHKVAALVAV
ncbi:MAG: response regulator [Aphanothece sp. CMT-3BRIN-NPC111]|jgi:two-component system sensor histidine kinase/response regulator|nr:response regulator [Aphanothece sp. CMT-3BRIN-NPC111]